MALVEVETLEPHISTITFNRPGSLNAITFELVGEFYDALDQVSADPDCKVVILTGAGRGFCSGLDLRDWGRPPEPGENRHFPAGMDAQTYMSNLVVRMRQIPQIIVAAVNGPAYGGGFAFACAADIRLAAPEARFCSAFIRTGLSGTDIGITYLLPHLIGNARAFDLILTGRTVEAAEAHEMGIVSRVSGPGELDDLALDYARTMAGYTASGLRTTKEVLWQAVHAPSLEATIALETRNQNLLQHAPDVQAFLANYSREATSRKE